MARKFAAVVFSLGCIHASSSFALGLGDLKLESFLNEPLQAKVDLLNTDGLHADQIRIRLATREDFERLGVDRAYFLTSIQFEVNVDTQGRGIISISSDDPVLEPYLDFIVEARWPSGRLLREYTVLVDPPLFDSTSPVVSASQRVAEVEGTPLPDDSSKKPQGAAATSGTRVDIKKSGLAAGAMPDRDFNAETSDTPRSGVKYMIHRDDTLWEIADSARPAGASVHQTMLDIQRLNPNAFIDGNINRIKAGYIVYLPDEGDISSQNLAAALAEVKQQNDDWQAGRASKPIATGPKLRISTDSVEESVEATADADAGDYTPGASAAAEEMEKAGLEQAQIAEELATVQQQVDTLQRIVSLKDDQIAALQAALDEAGGAATDGDPGTDTMADADAMAQGAPAAEAIVAAEVAEVAPEPEPEPEPVPAPVVKPTPAPAAQEGGMMSYLLYGLGALVLAVLAFMFVRRGKDEDSSGAASDAAFAEVQLTEERVEVAPEPVAEPEAESVAEPEPQPVDEALEDAEPARDNRGYGERKHDEYASDGDTGDALAEADIYIAYGRYPQAKDLLQNAINNDPGNTAFRLKLLEAELQMGNRAGAEDQLRELEAIGDAGSISRGREVLSGSAETFSEPPAGLADDLDGALESDFAGLEIESNLEGDSLEDDLDLTADFAAGGLAAPSDDEDLVIAAEANAMSTKLDLARAYMDMGDEDGARQILEEVVADGSEEQKAEAGALLERIG